MHNAAGVMTHGQEDDVYNVALMALIRDYVAAHPGIDRNRIYLGGCSNGGYMTLKLMLLQPDYFAAGFISSLAYPGTSPTSRSSASRRFRSGSCIPRMTRPRCPSRRCFPSTSGSGPQAPATSTSRSTTTSSTSRASSAERITATTGTGPRVYLHANQCRLDGDGSPVRLDGRPVSVMEWLSAQARAR